ncbi:MAG: hypothetical protein JJ975_07215 [Bacteroidia bacterium]|nr:hypothetical protein [Bacteroidia bacterium]
MKKLVFISSLLLFVAFGCADFDRRTQFNATYTNRVVLDSANTVPSTQHEVISDTLPVDFLGLVRDHSSNENGIESVSLVAVSVEIDKKKSPKAGTFDFLRNMEIFLRGKDTEEFLIGKADSVPNGGVRYFEVKVLQEEKDFTDFVKSEEFICRMKYTTDKRVQDSAIVIKITPTYLVDTKKFGV